MSEPPTMRYATAPMPRGVQITRATSWFSSANVEFPKPAKNTCHAVPANVGGPDCHFFDSTDPKAQLNEPSNKAIDHHSSLLPSPPLALSLGKSNTNVPVNPSARPPSARAEM